MAPKPSFSPSSLLLIPLFLLFSPKSFSQSENEILLKIKQDWGDPPALSSWQAAGDHCSWPEIKCSGGFVAEIHLSNANLSKPIPASICSLKNLSFLDVSYNIIPGPFPTALYNCSSLQHLDISQNYFVGKLPGDIDKMPPGLTDLILTANNFSGDIPPSIGRLPAIKQLHFDYNLFDGIISKELGNLSTLEYLCLAVNPFPPAKIPPEFGNLKSLTYLWMARTNLVGEIPEALGRLSNLEHLDLSVNRLVGKIPLEIWMLKQLKILYLYANNLTGEISETIAASGLVEIDVSKNELNGSIPEAVGELKNLSVLYLYFNNLWGEIPASIGRLPKLTDVKLFNNKFEGVLPPEIGRYSMLWNLEVDDNLISGRLPEYLCDGKALVNLVVFNNKLNGQIPESLGSCNTLKYLQIHNNGFSGGFPARIWSAANLSVVIALNNSLTGTLPDELPQNLTRLDIQNNQFSGNIPSSAQRLLVFLGDNNNFSGELQASFSDMPLLQVLSLSGNRISGEIPPKIGLMLKFLNQLNLRRNLLSGNIPSTIGFMQTLNALDLSENHLSGEIPPQLGNLKLSYFNVSFNDLSGEIPVPLQNQAYDYFSNPKLCSSQPIPNLHTCGNKSNGSDKLSKGLLVMFIILGAILLISVVVLASFILRHHIRRKNGNNDLSDCKLTSFHTVGFSEAGIMRGITDGNLIGSGGCGKVYRVAVGPETVAVKKIWNARKLDSKLEKEFQAEVEILGSIRHDNIVKLLCCISGADSKLLVYEYLENGSLDRWLHRRRRDPSAPPLDWPTRLQIAIGAARGLCHMHHHSKPPIIHRDVKSSNILLDPMFKAKIADFGLARILSRGGEPESVSTIAGSFGYMAPECGKLRKVNEKVDVYSFGVVLLELATGREASDGGDDEDINLCDRAWRRYKQGGGAVAEALDEDVVGDSPENLAGAEMVFTLGLICTGWDPATRPTMKEVLQVLLKLERARNGSWVDGGDCGSGSGSGGALLDNKSKKGSRRKMIAELMEESDDSGLARYAGIDSLI
ncbi:Receptor-like protein kinase HSL1 [Apostasia shenzhenica]|uniref:non-specific serine/threonine protein kinase n=1 Tax=Apostasia shenzhenica TaxID=1088818 RepID=A0A2I0B9K1_9ASPA|nr:Receptor-like protein kinase HSL1 [Apostasia shenzhenica]